MWPALIGGGGLWAIIKRLPAIGNGDGDTGGDPGVGVPSVDNDLEVVEDNIDGQKQHLTPSDLDAARREFKGEVVKRKPDGTPHDHEQEVGDAQRGLMNQIRRLRSLLDFDRGRLSGAQRDRAGQLLGEASRLLDHSEQFLPRR